MGWLTLGRGETLAGKAKNAAKEKVGDAVQAVNPVARSRKKRTAKHTAKGGHLCLGCNKPVRGRGNVHKRCTGAVANRYKSIMDVEG